MMEEEVTSPILAKYDDLVKSLENQISTYQTEHEFLKNEIMKLLTDNDKIRKKIDGDFQVCLEAEVSDKLADITDSELARNLRHQLELSWKERKQIAELFETSQKLIVKLERQIHSRPAVDINQKNKLRDDPVISVLQSKIEELSLELKLEKNVREEQEGQRLKHQTEVAKLRVLLDEKIDCCRRLEEDKLKRDENCMKLEQECQVLKATIECVTQSRDSLESAFLKSDKQIKTLEGKIDEARKKVEEAVEVAERAVTDRDNALKREGLCQDEVSRLRQSLDHIIEESAKRLTNESKQMKENFEQKLLEALEKQESQEIKLRESTDSLAKLRENYKLLEKELEKQKRREEKMRLSESANVDLDSRLEATRRRLEEAKSSLKELFTKNERLKKEVKEAQDGEAYYRDLATEVQMKLQGCRCVKLKEKLKQKKETKAFQVAELKRQAGTQLALIEKWEKETERLTVALETQLRAENKLRSKIKVLGAKLRQSLSFAAAHCKCGGDDKNEKEKEMVNQNECDGNG